MHKFNKDRVSHFYEISSTDSKFDTINRFYKYIKKLEDVKSKNKETKQRKITVLKNESLHYYKWVNNIKNNVISFLKVKVRTGGKSIIIKN